MLFKILSSDGRACHGGDGEWPLPKGKKPGAWYQVDGPKVCERGLHLVSRPLRWWKADTRLFVAEADLSLPMSSDGSEKAAFTRARLLYEVTADWPLLPMFPEAKVYLYMVALRRGDTPDDRLSLSGADLSGADLSGAYLSGADLSGANLSGAYLSRADLSGAYLSGANLSGAYLSGANLSGANLSGAYLSRAYLFRADLARADLSGAYRPSDPPAGWTPNKSGYLEGVK